MSILWMKFSEEATLPASFTQEEQRRLEHVYDPSDPQSIWSISCREVGVRPGRGPMISWYKNVPYVNWSELVSAVSCGWIGVVPQGGGWAYKEYRNFTSLMGLLKSQWKIERYVDKRIQPGAPLPPANLDRLIESTVLGIGLQAIMQRLPNNSPQEFAGWLAAPDKAPITIRKTMMQIQGIQRRRTLLSPAWLELFPPRPARDMGPDTPAMFWDYPPPENIPAQAQSSLPNIIAPEMPAAPPASEGVPATEWKGLPVCAGQVTGRAVIVAHLKDFTPPDMADLPILVFPRARPETVELFPHASALLFAEGGALSHACTVAREQGIPCVTALGPDFFRQLQDMSANQKVWLAMDGAGSVKIVKS